MSNLYAASVQWSRREPDERYENLDTLYTAAKRQKDQSRDISTRLRSMEIVATNNGDIVLEGSKGQAKLTNYAFRQLTNRLNFPADALSEDRLSAELAAQVLSYRRAKVLEQDSDTELQLLLQSGHTNMTVRSITSTTYARVFNADLIPFLQKLVQQYNFRVPPSRPAFNNQPGTRPATKADILPNQGDFGLAVKEGDPIAPGALFLGDREMFTLLVNTEDQIDDGTGRKLSTALMMENSEVGAASFKLVKANMARICGNLILWDVQDIVSYSYKHIGTAYDRVMSGLDAAERLIAQYRPEQLAESIEPLRRHQIAESKDEVVDNVYKLRLDQVLTKKVVEAGFDMAVQFRDLDGISPYSPWGLVAGITRHSQSLPYSDARLGIDTAAGKILNHYSAVLV